MKRIIHNSIGLFSLLIGASNVTFAQHSPNNHSEATISLVTMIEDFNEKLAEDDNYGDLSNYFASTLICGEGKIPNRQAQLIMRKKQINALQKLSKKSNLLFKKLTRGDERAMTITVSAIFAASEYQTKGMIISFHVEPESIV